MIAECLALASRWYTKEYNYCNPNLPYYCFAKHVLIKPAKNYEKVALYSPRIIKNICFYGLLFTRERLVSLSTCGLVHSHLLSKFSIFDLSCWPQMFAWIFCSYTFINRQLINRESNLHPLKEKKVRGRTKC